MAELSPMMRQYLEIKEQNKNCLLFFRVGDFYEMFFDDAITASRELELVLTGKDCGLEERAPMCGVPYHSCEGYIARLIEKGYRVAICEQVEDPATAKGLVKRDIIRIVTPGTVLEDSMLDESRNNYLVSICFNNKGYGLCFVDASTGNVNVTEISGSDSVQRVTAELGRFSPKEMLAAECLVEKKDICTFVKDRLQCCVTILDKEQFESSVAELAVCNHFKISSVTEKGLTTGSLAVCALGAALNYLNKTQMTRMERISEVNLYSDIQYMRVDVTAMRNLELTETMRNKEKKGSLLWVLDKTKTAMGKRLVRKWISHEKDL